ncbi:uncharacterized protein TNCV_4019081 [Trichonephila clavipes]|nr:uncharacterized protein TNCV_4019081 [Trichonephila clavipes]
MENTHRRPTGAETGKVLDKEVLSSFCKDCDSYKGVQFGIKYNKWQRAHTISCRKNDSGSAGRLTDSLIHKLAYYYGNAIRCNYTSVKEMRKAIWAVWGHSCSTDDEPMHWFCPTNPNTWCKNNSTINNNLQNYKLKPSVPKAVRDVIKPVLADLSHPALLKKCLGGKTQNLMKV